MLLPLHLNLQRATISNTHGGALGGIRGTMANYPELSERDLVRAGVKRITQPQPDPKKKKIKRELDIVALDTISDLLAGAITLVQTQDAPPAAQRVVAARTHRIPRSRIRTHKVELVTEQDDMAMIFALLLEDE